jgi:hypothetical protein
LKPPDAPNYVAEDILFQQEKTVVFYLKP